MKPCYSPYYSLDFESMSKRTPYGILLANWAIGLLFVLLIPRSAEAALYGESKSYFQQAKVKLVDLGSLPESVGLEFDLDYFDPAVAGLSAFQLCSAVLSKANVSAYDALPLFDVKQTFRHFFDTW